MMEGNSRRPPHGGASEANGAGREVASGRAILDALETLLEETPSDDPLRLIVPNIPSGADLSLKGGTALWRSSSDTPPPADVLADWPEIAEVRVRAKQRGVQLTLAPAWLTEIGGRLESGDPGALTTDGGAQGGRFVVDYLDPNATKALHVGHLRNLSIGHALTSIGAAAGMESSSQAHICDIGRSSGETLAGYLTYHRDETPASTSMKPDHFVGDCYSRYVAHLAETAPLVDGLASDPALSREDGAHADLAQQLLQRLHEGDEELATLWRSVRGWALEGQRETLERLGVEVDRFWMESDYDEAYAALADDAIELGLAEVAENGAVGFRTGAAEYPYMLLRLPNGQPTQHLRHIAVWRANAPVLDGSRSIVVMGDEWLPLKYYGDELLRLVDDTDSIHPTTSLTHGMVTMGDAPVKSSVGGSWLIDELLDDLSADPRVVELTRDARLTPDAVATILALSYCLGRPFDARMTISRELLLDPQANHGWPLATALAKALDPANDGDPDPLPDDPDYRFLALRSQLHPRLVAKALEQLDPLPLLQFHVHLSRWYLEADRPPAVARMLRTVLGQGLAALGLWKPQHERVLAATSAASS